jgi:hypothetical protein
MTQYLLSIYRERTLTEEEFQQSYIDVNAVADELETAGGLVFAGGLNRTSPTFVVRSVDGKIVTTDGPFTESKEQLGGFWIVEAAGIDVARALGAKLTAACRHPVEVCAFEGEDTAVEELFGHTA